VISKELTLILPTKNHEKLISEKIEYVSEFLLQNFEKHEIIIVSNGSREENTNLIKELSIPNIVHLIYETSGKGFAVREGIKNSKYNFVLICDSDFSVDIKFIKDFFKNGLPISEFVVGSRKIIGSFVEKSPFIRLISGGLFTFLTKYYLKIKISDTQCGFKLVDKTRFFNIDTYSSDDFFFDVELFILATDLNLSISEVPVHYIHNNQTSVNLLSDSLRMFLKILRFKRLF
jgi:dolichyl-phosphate beta-glucosyltransferase